MPIAGFQTKSFLFGQARLRPRLPTFKALALVCLLLQCQRNFNFMACFEVIILKNPIERAFKVKDGVNSNEKESTTNDISLSLDLINVKDSPNFYVGVSKP